MSKACEQPQSPVDQGEKPLTQVFFISTATEDVGAPGTDELIEATRRRNPQYNITGILLRTDRLFIQIAEGDEADLDRLMSAIRKDARHWDIREWPKRHTDRRDFAGWQARTEKADLAEALAGAAQTQQGTVPIATLIAQLKQLADLTD